MVPLETSIFADIVPIVESVEVQNRADGEICLWARTDQVDFVVNQESCPAKNFVLELRDFFFLELWSIWLLQCLVCLPLLCNLLKLLQGDCVSCLVGKGDHFVAPGAFVEVVHPGMQVVLVPSYSHHENFSTRNDFTCLFMPCGRQGNHGRIEPVTLEGDRLSGLHSELPSVEVREQDLAGAICCELE